MPTDVRVVGWDGDVGAILELVFMSGLALGAIMVVLVSAAALAILTRRGS